MNETVEVQFERDEWFWVHHCRGRYVNKPGCRHDNRDTVRVENSSRRSVKMCEC